MSLRAATVGLAAGGAFGAGIAVAGLARPEVVLGFLDVTGRWDATVGVVMLVATAVNAAVVAFATRRGRPLWAPRFVVPTAGAVDGRLVAGAAHFGVGWGLAGVCPGPALASLGAADRSVVTFVASMVAGLWLVDVVAPSARRLNHGKEQLML